MGPAPEVTTKLVQVLTSGLRLFLGALLFQ